MTTTMRRPGIEADALARATQPGTPIRPPATDERETVRALCDAQPDQPEGGTFADMLGLNEPVRTATGVGHTARHYHGATIPHATKVGRWV
jgi:hypothetical protein